MHRRAARRAFLLVIFGFFNVWSSLCGAEERSHGVALYESANFDAAVQYFEAVISAPSATPAELAEAYLYLAALRLSSGGGGADTERLIRAAAAVAPTYAAPFGLPPRVTELHAEALASQPSGGLSLSVEVAPCSEARAERHLRVELRGPAQDLISTVSVHCDGGSGPVDAERSPGEPFDLSIPFDEGLPTNERSCEIAARSEAGAALRLQRVALEPCHTPRPEAEEEAASNIELAPGVVSPEGEELTSGAPTTPHRRVGLWVGLGVGVAVAVVAVVVGVVLGTQQTEATFGPVGLDGF